MIYRRKRVFRNLKPNRNVTKSTAMPNTHSAYALCNVTLCTDEMTRIINLRSAASAAAVG